MRVQFSAKFEMLFSQAGYRRVRARAQTDRSQVSCVWVDVETPCALPGRALDVSVRYEVFSA